MSVQEEYRLLEMEVEEMSGKVERLTEECQERSDQANQWYKALQVHTVIHHTPYIHYTSVHMLCMYVTPQCNPEYL